MSRQSIPLLIIGRTRPIAVQQGENLAPHFTYTAVIDLPRYTVENLRLVLETLNPTPKGVLVGGGVSVEVQQEVEAFVKERNESKGEGERLHFICIPVGIKEKLGAEGLMVWLKDALSGEFGIAW
jgi:hypothetical protein